MRLASPIVLSTLTAACFCASACSTTTAPTEAPAASETEASQPSGDFVVVPLQFAAAMEIANAVNMSLQSRDLRAQPFERTNSVILVGSASEIARAKELIAKLDIHVK